MLVVWRNCALTTVLLLLVYCGVSLGGKPILTPDVDQLVLKEGDPLEIECVARQEIFFHYPVTIGDAITTSEPELERFISDNNFIKYIFRRRQTVHGDTGWYGCSDRNISNVNVNDYFDTSISWLYVYVTSPTNLFVQVDTIASFHEVSGGTAIIPCRPTSPNLVVILEHTEEVELNDKVTYDPRIGFTLRNLTLKDSGYYKCVIHMDGEDDHEVNYQLLVQRKHTLNEPKIIDDTLRHVTRGQTLHVNCTVDVDADVQYVFNWTTPQQSDRITSRHENRMIGVNTRRAICELTIVNVMDEDEGEYECVITTMQASKKTKKYITVHDPGIKYINLSSQNANRNYEGKIGDYVQWVVNVDCYPRCNLQWYNPKGEVIEGIWSEKDRAKYAITTTTSSTILKINRLDVKDMGIYSLQATNKGGIETMNFTLTVLFKPIPIFERIESYYEPNTTAEIRCHVAAFPPPNITWTFLRCPKYPSYEESSIIYLTQNLTESVMETSVLSTVRVPVEVSGHLNCTACNALGCDYAIDNILVSDGNGGFGILESRNLITEGDEVNITCAASIYNYTSDISWWQNDIKLEPTERMKIVQTKTQFTYRSILRFQNITKSDSKTYMCVGRTTDGQLEDIETTIRVHSPAFPYINETNMNGSEVIIDLGTQGHKTKILKCFASGMPKPNVTWTKDGVVLKRNEQYLFLHNNQELHIKYLLEHDSGKYACHAENRVGKKEVYQIIVIKGKALPLWVIILITVLVILVLILIVYFTIKVRREKIMRKELMEAGLMHFEEGALECLNPDLTVDDQAELLPYDKKWEFPRERLKLGKQLGSGAFGVVMKAEAQGICEEEAVTTVAVKMVRRTTDPTYVRALASELKIMVHLGKHLNVVNLLGACTKNISKRELLVIVEYCRFGNLHNYLMRHRANFINQIDPVTGKFDHTIGLELLTRTASVSSSNRIKYAALSFSRSLSANSSIGVDTVHYTHNTEPQSVSMSPDGCVLSNNSLQPGWRSNYRGDYKDHNLKPICTQDLLSWAFQVARGMEYLSQRKVLHGDLAARNILLAENNIVKICDFGLAKTMYKDDNYKKKGDGPLPIKWMAIESIRDRMFSTQSDIWSFGIVLWEFFTLAETPYPGMEAEKQYQKLIEGYRMEQPEYATQEVYDIMLRCWKAKPTLRPSFTELVEDIGNLLEESVRIHYVSLNAPYMDMNTMLLESGKNDYLTMMSAPDHSSLSSPTHDYVNSPVAQEGAGSSYLCMSSLSQKDEESGIFSPRPHPEKTHFEFPSMPTSDSEDALEVSPMLKKIDEDPYLKPINVHERRAEFARQRQAMKNRMADDRPIDRDSGYCNTPRNLSSIDRNGGNVTEDMEKDERDVKKKEFAPTIIRTTDNYVNMPKQKSDLRRDMPDGFSNPSYVMMSDRID